MQILTPLMVEEMKTLASDVEQSRSLEVDEEFTDISDPDDQTLRRKRKGEHEVSISYKK